METSDSRHFVYDDGRACCSNSEFLHTIRPMRATARDIAHEVPLEQAESFSLFRYEQSQINPSDRLSYAVKGGFATFADAHRYALDNGLKLEPICEQEGCFARKDLTSLACFGGASGIAYACPTHYLDHLRHGGVTETGEDNTWCDICLYEPLDNAHIIVNFVSRYKNENDYRVRVPAAVFNQVLTRYDDGSYKQPVVITPHRDTNDYPLDAVRAIERTIFATDCNCDAVRLNAPRHAETCNITRMMRRQRQLQSTRRSA